MKTLISAVISIGLGSVAFIITKQLEDRYMAGLIVGTTGQLSYWATFMILGYTKIKIKP